jgi:hypothetical protein
VPRSSRLQRRDAGDTAPSDALLQKLDHMPPRHVFAFLCLAALNPAFGMDAGKIAMAAKSLAPNVLWQEKSVLKANQLKHRMGIAWRHISSLADRLQVIKLV